MPETSKPSEKANATNSVADDPSDTPVTPVENFELGRIDKDRRIFQNGDTDRTPGEDEPKSE